MAYTRFPEYLIGLLDGFLEDLQNRMADNLVSVTVYGSAARGDFVEGVSDINALVVARTLTASDLKAAGRVVRHWRERMPIAPVFATEEYITRSADVFPLEFLEMREAHRTLHGPDPLANLPIAPRYLRRQVEAEMKGKLMRLRAAYADAADDPNAVRDLLAESLPSFRTLFQGTLRLAGEAPPTRTADVLRAVTRRFDLDATALDDALAVRQSRPRADGLDVDSLFGRYLEVIERLAHIVDQWDEKGDAA